MAAGARRNPDAVWMGLLAMAVAALGVWAWQLLRTPDHFPVRVVEVHGAFDQVLRETIEGRVAPVVMAQGFFGLQLADIQRILAQEPWVAQVQVSRVWPDRVRVVYQEQRPVARWNEQGLLTGSGDGFTPRTIPSPFASLPHVWGQEGDRLKIFEKYQTMVHLLADTGLSLRAARRSERHAWSVEVVPESQDRQPVVRVLLGQREALSRLARFVALYQRMAPDCRVRMAVADMRYNQGMAVGWRQQF